MDNIEEEISYANPEMFLQGQEDKLTYSFLIYTQIDKIRNFRSGHSDLSKASDYRIAYIQSVQTLRHLLVVRSDAEFEEFFNSATQDIEKIKRSSQTSSNQFPSQHKQILSKAINELVRVYDRIFTELLLLCSRIGLIKGNDGISEVF